MKWASAVKNFLFIAALVSLSCNCTPGHAQMGSEKLIFPAGTDHVEIPFTRYNGWIVIEVRINSSKSFHFIFDTGAPIAVLASNSEADHLNLSRIGFANMSGSDPGKPEKVPLAGSVTFQIGPLLITDCIMAIGAGGMAIGQISPCTKTTMMSRHQIILYAISS
jgi:hypothetical protein